MSEQRDEPLSSGDIARVREVFGKVCDVPRGEREVVLKKECGDEPRVQAAVRELLAAHDEPSGVLDSGQGEIGRQLFREVDGSRTPERIGPYTIRSVIGQGGMGVVYLAEQSNPHREVALKIIRRGWNSAGLRSRFEREIRVLGRLQHPGITHIYEAGTAETRDGPVAFFAMEFVSGKPLNEAVGELGRLGGLTLAERVELVAKIADAVQHAHTKGVIHRDLKPANILVSDVLAETIAGDSQLRSRAGGPQPKILDFGVARVLEPDTVHTQVTEQGHVIGTISYMSPEQLGGDVEAVDARTDVYALGVILYELITGRLPHDLKGKQIAEAARIVRDDPPSTMQGLGEPRLDRDLQTIVLHAMEKDRERRYATAAAFAEDLRRYLRSETILAKPATALDQFSKFAKRNKGLVVGLSAAALAVMSGLVISTVLYVKEQKARERADAKERLNAAFKEYMIDGVLLAASPERKGWEVKVMDVLADATQQLKGRFPDDPEIEGSLRMDLGAVLKQVGKWKESKEEYLAALPLVEKVHGGDSVEYIRVLNCLASSHQMLQENEDWLRVGSESLRKAEARLGPGNFERITAMNNVGGALVTLGKLDEAREILTRAKGLAEKDPFANRSPLANIYNWLVACETGAKNTSAAVEMRRKNLEFMIKVYGPEHLDTLAARANLVVSLLNAKDRDEVIRLLEGLPEQVEKATPPGHPFRSHIYAIAGLGYSTPGQFEKAEKYLLKTYELQSAQAKDFDWLTETRINYLRQLYTRWPGHGEECVLWNAHAIKARLMLATVGELENFPSSVTTAVGSCQQAGVAVSRVEMVKWVWERRDELAPEGHGRRAAFYANFARMAVGEGVVELAREAVVKAQESLGTEGNLEGARALIAAAEAMLIGAEERAGEGSGAGESKK